MNRSRIFIVDDHPLVREGLVARINQQADLAVCGESDNARDAFRQVIKLQPDLVLIDLSLKNSSGLDLINRVHAHFPDMKLIAISMYEEEIYGPQTRRSGASGYISKREISVEILDAVNKVLSGKTYFRLSACNSENPLAKLSNRESQVFELLAQGLTMADISARLHISKKTTETHRENIKSKLDLKSSHALTVYASRMTTAV